MTTQIPSTSSSVNYVFPIAKSGVQQTALRRQLQGELHEIKEKLDHFGGEDPVTQYISKWRDDFEKALRVPDIEPVIEAYITLMKEAIIDSILPELPLDEDALLGSDGRAYNKKVLCLLMHKLSDRDRNRWLQELGGEGGFTTQPHEVARHMVRWLARHGVDMTTPDIDEEYFNLSDDEKRVLIPNEMNNLVHQIRAGIAQEQRLEEDAIEWLEAGIDQLEQKINVEMAKREGMIEQMEEGISRRLDEVERQREQTRNAINERIEQLDREIHQAEEERQKLSREREAVEHQIKEAEKDDLEVKEKIEELNKEVKKLKKRKWQGVLTTCLIIAGSFAGTWLLQAAARAVQMSASVSMVPKAGGAAVRVGMRI